LDGCRFEDAQVQSKLFFYFSNAVKIFGIQALHLPVNSIIIIILGFEAVGRVVSECN